jgi:hypothetical protein
MFRIPFYETLNLVLDLIKTLYIKLKNKEAGLMPCLFIGGFPFLYLNTASFKVLLSTMAPLEAWTNRTR